MTTGRFEGVADEDVADRDVEDVAEGEASEGELDMVAEVEGMADVFST
ncbi:hypothetical protein [Streptomyces cyslabdanicus]